MQGRAFYRPATGTIKAGASKVGTRPVTPTVSGPRRLTLAAAAPGRESQAPMGRFDAAYYEQYYENATTCVSDQQTIRRLAAFVAGYLEHLDIPVRSILDIGCGVGHWQGVCRELWPEASYHGVEISEYLCDKLGWHHASITDLDPTDLRRSGTFDLVICQGVLQYLSDRQAARAINNLGAWCDGALYLEALTARDWRENVDRQRTDGEVHLRAGEWYRKRLTRHFQNCGGGVFASRAAGVTLFELEGNA
ncbi:MAG: class I SAM-dependent methyltransferase [bacterium]|nr:class I SAM-dependent methyltransferase [bacterium]